MNMNENSVIEGLAEQNPLQAKGKGLQVRTSQLRLSRYYYKTRQAFVKAHNY